MIRYSNLNWERGEKAFSEASIHDFTIKSFESLLFTSLRNICNGIVINTLIKLIMQHLMEAIFFYAFVPQYSTAGKYSVVHNSWLELQSPKLVRLHSWNFELQNIFSCESFLLELNNFRSMDFCCHFFREKVSNDQMK